MTELKSTFDEKKVKRALTRIRNRGYDWSTSRDRHIFSQFYHDFFLPSISNRFGEEAIIDSFEQFQKWRADGGELLIVRQNQEWVAGSLNLSDGDRYLTPNRRLSSDPASFQDEARTRCDLAWDL